MSKNIEAKAHYPDLQKARAICEKLGARLKCSQEQRDTYFAAPNGRLKLRESNVNEPCIVHYTRSNMPSLRESTYRLVKVPDAALREALSDALGVQMVVNKRRDTYELRSALVNLDQVDDLGTFVEIEVDAIPASSTEDPEQFAQWLKQELQIRDNDILPWSYAEMLAMQKQARVWRERLSTMGKRGNLFLIDGPSASGKTSNAETLLKDAELGITFVRRHCTRTPRSSDENEYVFVSSHDFRSLASAGQFFEFRDYLFGMSYGMTWEHALQPVLEGRNALGLMNWGNARWVRRVLPEAKLILVTAPLDTLRRRLISRGIHNEDQLNERLHNARRLAGNDADYDLIAPNEDGSLSDSVNRIKQYILSMANLSTPGV
jgi:adenylate cyclase, class 2